MSALFVISELLMVTRWKAVFNATKRCVCQTLCRREARGQRGNLRQGKKCGSVCCCLSHSATTFSFNPQLVFVFWQGSICVCAALKAREITKCKKKQSKFSLVLGSELRLPVIGRHTEAADDHRRYSRRSWSVQDVTDVSRWLALTALRCHTVTAKKYKWAVG